MEIAFNLPHVFNPLSKEVENSYVLRALLDALVSINKAYLRNHTVPALYRSGVVYGRTKLWEPIPALYRRGFGDCKSLSAALIAQYAKEGIESVPVFRFRKHPITGKTDFHILVQKNLRGIVQWEDPSKKLGMGTDESKWFRQE